MRRIEVENLEKSVKEAQAGNLVGCPPTPSPRPLGEAARSAGVGTRVPMGRKPLVHHLV